MRCRAIITDLDGTVVDSPTTKVASERLAAAVRGLEVQGIKVCAATGRPQSFAMPVLTSMGLTEPTIVAGGTRIIDPVTKQQLWSADMSQNQMQSVMDMLKNCPYGCLWNDYVEDDYLNGGWDIATFNKYEGSFFFEVCYVEPKIAQDFIAKLNRIPGIMASLVVAHREGLNDIHVTNAAATKEHAVIELEKIIGVARAQMIGVGDGHNDLHLFKAVGYKVAMGNAVDDLKAEADEVIGRVGDDGLAEYLEKIAIAGGIV